MLKVFFLAFIPIFVAVDALGVLPLFISLTQSVKKKEKAKIIFEAMIIAFCLAIGFLFVGMAIFKFLGITVGDFMIAGGVVLFCIAIVDVIAKKKSSNGMHDVGAVPLGTPLIVGPAVLTTCLVIIPQYGFFATLVSMIVNIILAGLIFSWSDHIIRFIGESGSRALSKVTSLLLAAIAVKMIRMGIMLILAIV